MKIVFIISLTVKSSGFEELFIELKKRELDFHVLLINPSRSQLYDRLIENNIPTTEYYYYGKKSIFSLVFKTRKLLKNLQPTHVHSQLMEGGLIGGLASWLSRIPIRIYSRHHGDTHFYEKKRGRIYDRLIQALHTKIICLSKGHYNFLTEFEKIKPEKLELIPNFIDEKLFDVSENRSKTVQEKYGFDSSKINIGINARWTELKGLHFILPAILTVSKKYPEIRVYLFNAKGDYKLEVLKYVDQFDASTIKCIEFEADIMSVYPHFNVFLHCPIRKTAESFGLVYIEAMGSGLPCILTLSGIANDIVLPNENALVVDYNSSTEIENALLELIEFPEKSKMISENAKKIAPLFTIEIHTNKLIQLYKSQI